MATASAWIGGLGVCIGCDVWQSFEFTAAAGTVTDVQLASTGHSPGWTWGNMSSGGDPNSMGSTSTNDEQATIHNPQCTVDTGTRGLNILLTNVSGVSSACSVTSPNDTSSVSWAFWIKTAAIASGNVYHVFQVSSRNTTNACCFIYFQNSAGTHQIALNTNNGTVTINVTAGNTYWVTGKYISNGTCSVAVFDTNGNQVGTTQTSSDTNGNNAGVFYLGVRNATTNDAGVNLGFDDELIDQTTAIFPLGP